MPFTSGGRLSRVMLLIGASAICAMMTEPAMAQDAAPVTAATVPVAAPQPTLEQMFADPPMAARPRVWWHWMNGNISREGIARDLEWMQRVGIGGFQNFDASLMTPQLVDQRLVYMTPEWREAFRFAASEAQRRGLEMGIAASPGWSETGGPWVTPQDGMKKLVWAEARVAGGRRYRGLVPQPPTMTGPYQTAQFREDMGPHDPHAVHPQASGRIAVLAVPVREAVLPEPQISVGGVAVSGAAVLGDADLETGLSVPLDSDRNGEVLIRYPRAVTVRSIRLLFPGIRKPFRGLPILPVLEARIDGAWRPVTDLPLTGVASTHSFDAITAQEFRVRIQRNPNEGGTAELAGAPGAIAIDIFDFGALEQVQLTQLMLSAEPLLDEVEAKAGYETVLDYTAITSDDASPATVRTADVIDLSDRVMADGRIDWTPPAGSDWRILSFGWSLTGKTNHPATPEATGLEVDKYDAAAVRRYLETYLAMYRETVGEELMGDAGLRALLTDSIEVGKANWTPGLEAEFARRRGYALRPWLPALTGLVLGSDVETERFLHDFRRTLAELLADVHYRTVADVAHEHGLIVYGEALEDKRPLLGDDLDMRRFADVPMAALWTWAPDGQPRSTLIGDMRGAASVAHVYGRTYVAAESLTSANWPWAFAPNDLRPMIDLAFAHGVNRPTIHTSVHVPVEDRQPGLSLAIFGQYFNRNETWADMARPWVDYLSRTGMMLQQGHNVADVAWFIGEEAPITAQFASSVPEGLPARHAYDFVNATMLREALRVENGLIVSDGGARYRLLFLGGEQPVLSLPTLRRIAELVDGGATLVGNRPVASPSLADDQGEFGALAERLWSSPQVLAGAQVDRALDRLGIAADFVFDGGATDSEILFVHRRLDDNAGGGDAYFLTNRRNRTESGEARFRVTGRVPYAWDAVTGSSRPLSWRTEGEHIVVPLTLAAHQSLFILFREVTAQTAMTVADPVSLTVAARLSEWQVAFQPGRGAPETVSMAALQPLNEAAEPGVRHFSGTASYTATLTLPRRRGDGPLWLDLGWVGDVAEVLVNGQSAGIVWTAPYRVDIAPFARRGSNVVTVRVANLWVNRLIGDAQPGAERVTFVAAPTYLPDAPLRAAGLIGPVTVSEDAR